jgi:hypothetical protein
MIFFSEAANDLALSAWLRQAGFEMRLQGSSGPLRVILATKLKPVS